jgi:hypothetical protein
MNIQTIFYTQLASVLGFISTVFVLYRILIKQKDSTIELLKERISYLESKFKDIEKQSPDVLVESIARRYEIAKSEITRLREDGEGHKGQIAEKEDELSLFKYKLDKLVNLVAESDLVCPYCGAPLTTRNYYTIYGPGDQDAGVERVEYECGYVRDEGSLQDCHHCGRLPSA